MPADIAFVTVNYNTLEWIRKLADFFAGLDAPFKFSFVVVDNDSQDGSQEFLKSQPQIRYLQAGENLGYGRAINRGVRATESKYVCVMNSDVALKREALVALWRFMEERPEAGVCAPRIKYADGRDQGMTFQASLFAHYATWYAKARAKWGKLRIARANGALRVDGVLGAFLLVRRSAMPERALFDEEFFFFYEDSALAHLLKKRGVACFILPAATIVHTGGGSRGESAIPLFYESKYRYLRKFYGPRHARAVQLLDRLRILRKWGWYSLCTLVSASERMRFKQRYYRVAWKSTGSG